MKERPNILLIVIDCTRSDKGVGTDRRSIIPNSKRDMGLNMEKS